jgi:exodeoxyribonuclease VII small subunit
MESIETLSFEEALAELTSVVEKLEDGTLALDQTVVLYQRGRSLAAHCQQLLDAVDVRIQQLVPDVTGGHTVVDFDG